VFVWRTVPAAGRSASTRTPISIEVRQTALTAALKVISSPTCIGSRNVIRSTPAVTTRSREWRMAASAAASSHSRRIVPPCTNPALLASVIPIQRTRTERDSEAGRGSTTREANARAVR
jgi:hypothetical protein